MIEVGKFEERRILTTLLLHGAWTASFYDGKTNMPCDKESADVVTITEYNDKDEDIYNTRLYRGDGVKHGTIPGFLLKGK